MRGRSVRAISVQERHRAAASGRALSASDSGVADYTTVTEAPGTLVSPEALEMVRTRYGFAASRCSGRAVLEVACGPGPGLGVLAAGARRLIAGDFTESLLRQAQEHYGPRVPLVRLDATHLPFRAASFDVVVLFEAIYFLPDVDAFLECCDHVLAPGGHLLLVSVNPEWDAFNPAPFATKYWTATELKRVCCAHGFEPELYAGFPAQSNNLRGRLMTRLKRLAVRLGLIPKTMKGKELLKRVAFGRLASFPAEVPSDAIAVKQLRRLDDMREAGAFKVLYVVAQKRRA